MSFLGEICKKVVDGLQKVHSIFKNVIDGVIRKLRLNSCLQWLRREQTIPTDYSASIRSSNKDTPSLVEILLDSSTNDVSSADGGETPENISLAASLSSVSFAGPHDDSEDDEEEEILISNCVLTVQQDVGHRSGDPSVENERNQSYLMALTKGKEKYSQPHPEAEVKVKKVNVNKTPVAGGQGGIWIKHYCSSHRILVVGDGDFSFSACLAVAFVSAPRMIATSLNSKEFLKKNYANAESNLGELRARKAAVMYKIDCTTMRQHPALGKIKFDRIIFNFPHAGFHGNKLDKDKQLRLHRKLVSGFLMNAKEMVSEDGGEIHITHKTNGFHSEWMVESIASSHGLRLIQAVKFKQKYYPGYNTKYGFGGDKNFDCNPSKTYKFGLKTSSSPV